MAWVDLNVATTSGVYGPTVSGATSGNGNTSGASGASDGLLKVGLVAVVAMVVVLALARRSK